MTVRKEVIHRLLLAKSILSPARTSTRGQSDAHQVAKYVLSAHDAADLVFAAIADHQNKLPPTSKSPSMMQCLELIESDAEKPTGYFKQLNVARNSLKHAGNLPNTNQWASVAEDVFDKLSEICESTLQISLSDLDESELIASSQAKAHLSAAKNAKELPDFKLALEEVGKALFVSLQEAPYHFATIQVGRARAEDALKLTAFGVSANDFLRLQEFLPIVLGSALNASMRWESPEVSWKQSEFGHSGNWREEVVDFCIDTYVDVAVSIQNVSAVPYAFPFSTVYEYKVTAKEDDVEIWQDLVADHQDWARMPGVLLIDENSHSSLVVGRTL